MSWRNDDGLLVKFGVERAVVQNGGFISTSDGKLVWEFDVDLTNATTTDAQVTATDNLFVPTGVHIEKIYVNIMELPTTANANLDLGLGYYLHAPAGTWTAKDYDGLLAVADFGDFGVLGDIHEYVGGGTGSSATEVGALVGTTITTTTESGYPDHYRFYFNWSADTTVHLDGALRIRVVGHIPSGVGF